MRSGGGEAVVAGEVDDSRTDLEYARLARMLGRIFYSKKNQGLHCVLLNALTKHEWIKEDMLAKQLGLSWRQVRKTLRELELDLMVSRIVMRDSRASTSLSSKIESTHSYCCLDYKRMFDVCRLKLYKMKKFLKDELDDKTKIEDYLCSTEDCGRNYTSLEVLDLEVDPRSFEFLCEDCGGALDNGSAFAQSTDEKKKHREKIKEQLLIFDEEFAPLTALLKTVQASGDPPYFGTLQEWAVMQRKMRQARNGEDPLGQASEGFVLEFDDDDDDDENAADGNAKPRQVTTHSLTFAVLFLHC
mmetsp:Transcript_15230/g.38731  ORF Transcript_15230/g.38731 Transcript_15230/m.38731 type:complete len:301 (-) Transcript_15230:216-1118(-)